jgi:carboxymethylenebutenolidase
VLLDHAQRGVVEAGRRKAAEALHGRFEVEGHGHPPCAPVVSRATRKPAERKGRAIGGGAEGAAHCHAHANKRWAEFYRRGTCYPQPDVYTRRALKRAYPGDRSMSHADAQQLTGVRDELDSLRPPLELSRRGFVQTSLAAGFAAAVLPVQAQTMIMTDTQGLTAGEVKIPAQGGEMPAYRAMPAGKSGLGTVLVVQEIFGVHEHIKDVCRRLAKAGYLAVAPELYARQGDPSKYTEIPKLISEIVAKVSDAQVMADLDAAAAWAGKNGGDAGRLAITGFCWGGRVVWMYAAHNPKLKTGVAWYGPVARAYHAGDKTALDVAAAIKQPMLGLYGAADGGIPNDTVDKMKAALQAAGNKGSEFVLYPDTPHAFHADYRPSYRKEAAEDGWKRLLAWFRTHGIG